MFRLNQQFLALIFFNSIFKSVKTNDKILMDFEISINLFEIKKIICYLTNMWIVLSIKIM